MQIIENWSEVTGTVRSRQPAPGYENFVAVELAVAEVKPVEDYPNLLHEREGTLMDVLVPTELAEEMDITPGDILVARVRRANLHRVFAHRNHLSVEHSG